jgi:hypothetical protein
MKKIILSAFITLILFSFNSPSLAKSTISSDTKSSPKPICTNVYMESFCANLASTHKQMKKGYYVKKSSYVYGTNKCKVTACKSYVPYPDFIPTSDCYTGTVSENYCKPVTGKSAPKK